MKKGFCATNMLLILALSIILITGCGEEPTPSLFDPDKQDGPTPMITEIIPPDNCLAGITLMTFKGQNFSINPDENFVFFNELRVNVLTASTTELTLKSPNLVGDSIKIKMAVHGAELFSNIIYYKMEYTAYEYGGINQSSDAYGLAYDNEGNIYVSFAANNSIVKITPEEEQKTYVASAGGFFKTMKMGPGGYLYTGRTKFIYQVPPGGGSIEQFGAILPQVVNDFDFDPDNNIFVASKNGIYCVRPDGTNKLSADYPTTTLKSLRVFNGYVYAAGDYTGTDQNAVKKGIWRNKITSSEGGLDNKELVFDWGSLVGEFGPNLLAITFAEDGDLYMGADAGDAITVIHPNPDGNYVNGSTAPLFPEVLTPQSTVFCWDDGQYLFVNRKGPKDEDKRLIRVTMGKKSAPYYGRQ